VTTAMAGAVPLEREASLSGERVVCTFCGTRINPATVERAAVPSNVRAFSREIFHVWRCPTCRSLHCLETVDLPRYYANYPIVRTLTPYTRITFDNLLGRLTKHGFNPKSTLLDYGCGWGVFLRFLQDSGYVNAVGYDPYSGVDALRNSRCLKPRAFDYIVLQDVIEHVEDPRAVFAELNEYLKPGGCILVGTPTADPISLTHYKKHWTQLHLPYHLHIYTRAAIKALGIEAGWTPAEIFDRPYYDTKTFGLNAWAVNKYQSFTDGTLDALFEPVPVETLRRSLRYLLMARFGYWFKRNTGEISILFRKQP
jgi:SAM-dependent methyltransferase